MAITQKQRNMFYGDPKALDLTVMQKNAAEHSSDTRMTSEPPVVVIHFHRADESCDNKTHETYIQGKKT